VKPTLLSLLTLCVLTALPVRGAEPRNLLTFLDPGKSATLHPSPGIAAERRVRIDLGALSGNPRLELLDGTIYETRETGREQRGNADLTWRGKLFLAGKEVGQMTLTAVSGRTAATITLPSGLYQIEPLPGGEERLVEMAEAELPPCAGGVSPHIQGGGLPRPKMGKAAASGPSVIDVLVLYTPPVLVKLGSVDAVRANVQNAIDLANTSYQNSQINDVTVRLVGLEEMASFPVEDGGLADDEITAFQADPTPAALRKKYKADLVSLYVENMVDACGVGFEMDKDGLGSGFAPFAYSVIQRRCGPLTLAHEMGHNMGCAHDPDNAGVTPAETSFPYSFGHGVLSEFHTVMAYPGSCGDVCLGIANFSNPDVSYNGTPTGIADQRDNHRTIENTRALVASFGDATSSGPTTPCKPDSKTLCLLSHRFQVRLSWENQYDGSSGAGKALPRTDIAGFFTFGDPSNVELMIKVLNFGDVIKVFYGELTDLHFTLTVSDTKTGNVNTYSNTAGNCGAIDQTAFGSDTAGSTLLGRAFFPKAAASGSCKPGANTLCLGNGRFAVSVDWANPGNNTSGVGGAVPLSAVTGAFYFTDPSNLELLTKLLDFGDRIAFFYGTLSDLQYTLAVRDTVSGKVQSYHNAAGTFCGGLDNHAF
jgi:hypothetical protein